MVTSSRMLQTAQDWATATACLRRAVDLTARFPSSPFTAEHKKVMFASESEAFDADLGLVIAGLMWEFGDDRAYGCQLEPDRSRAWVKKSMYPGFVLDPRTAASDYEHLCSHEPVPLLSIQNEAAVFSVAGTSGGWALWAQPQWDILALASRREPGAWFSQSPIRWFAAEEVPRIFWAHSPGHIRPSAFQQDEFRRAFASASN